MSRPGAPQHVRLPDRVTAIPSCIGCGALSKPGTCVEGCSEHRLDLVPAGEHDGVAEVLQIARRAERVLRAVVAALAEGDETGEAGGDPRVAFLAAQDAARRALREAPAVPPLADEPAEPLTAWWCAECGAVDAPQPCIGVCIRPAADWVNAAVYAETLADARAAVAAHARLASLLGRLAHVTPRDGQWARNLEALRAQARAVRAETTAP